MDDCEDHFLFVSRPEPRDWPSERLRLEELMRSDPDFTLRSDHAVALIHLGRVKDAVAILETLATEHPAEYAIAANLGTALELSGRDEAALEWIRRALELNPESHFGTEWVHVEILEAKIALATDPSWLMTHSVLGLDFGSDAIPLEPTALPRDASGRPQALGDVREALEYQLRERLAFVKPPDPVVAALLFDLANLSALTLPAECCIPFFDLSLTYGHPNADLIGRRVARATEIGERNERVRATKVLRRPHVILVASLVALLLVLVVLQRRARRRAARAGR